MVSITTNAQTYIQQLEAAQNERMERARALAGAAAQRANAQAQLDDADAAYAASYDAARSVGWTERELQNAGLTAPTKPKASTRRAAGGTRRRAGTATATPPEAGPGTQSAPPQEPLSLATT